MKKLPFAEPEPQGAERALAAKEQRERASLGSLRRPHSITRANGEETDHGAPYPANFTKGLFHSCNGLVEKGEDYRSFVEAINSPEPNLFEREVRTPDPSVFHCKVKKTCEGDQEVTWRGWESPRSGHVFDLEGPDAGAMGMAPAPRVGSSELAAEMAEVYALALLRDVSFTTIQKGGDKRFCCDEDAAGPAVLSAQRIVELLNEMAFYSGKQVVSSTPHVIDSTGMNRFERNRRFARTQSLGGSLSTRSVFRGSTPGAAAGPYLSQFMLIGNFSLACRGGGRSSFPGTDAAFDLQDGFIRYGSLIIDQRTLTHRACLDYMTDWCSWLDVQNGANFKDTDQFEAKRRFITTPRDLATYVHFDALYEAYLNACLILLSLRVPPSQGMEPPPYPTSKGFPEPSPTGRRDAFATFGGPHVLTLVTEVATRCLKAVRRQKFNYHRRARPEALAGRLTLANLQKADLLKCSGSAFVSTRDAIPPELLEAVIEHNKQQNQKRGERHLQCPEKCPLPGEVKPKAFEAANLLLPMAFPEGSPMHPSYGAGHATVAGGCVTMLKAFFEMFEDCGGVERELTTPDGKPISWVPTDKGDSLKSSGSSDRLTVQGELDKLAANISIGRNMAGVHYYSDYYDSLRMGERVAVGMLLEQAPTYGEVVETSFTSFDGDLVTISGQGGSQASLSILGRDGSPVSPDDWWLRHVSGQELIAP
ncbi:hypothetical protein Pan216_23740 [Planctomycetes bacterium Pan216]|uniref:PAP2 superfamily protein n=1 Tax=Kolteria novifilia TaxID=2527975 RepID=A0A518B3E2_9BACT|nr:hypothetical protein Pan216_23740 [Planctomycetes bacterium Pan216]